MEDKPRQLTFLPTQHQGISAGHNIGQHKSQLQPLHSGCISEKKAFGGDKKQSVMLY